MGSAKGFKFSTWQGVFSVSRIVKSGSGSTISLLSKGQRSCFLEERGVGVHRWRTPCFVCRAYEWVKQ